MNKTPLEKLASFDLIRIKIRFITLLLTWLLAPFLGGSGVYSLIILFFGLIIIYPSFEMLMLETYIEWYLGISIQGGSYWLIIFFLIDLILMYALAKKMATSNLALKIRYCHFILTLPLVIIWWFIPQGDASQLVSGVLSGKPAGQIILGAIFILEAYLSLFYTAYLIKKARLDPTSK
jgi:hypothetical protein